MKPFNCGETIAVTEYKKLDLIHLEMKLPTNILHNIYIYLNVYEEKTGVKLLPLRWLVGCLFGWFYGISAFAVYLTSNPFIYK